MYRYRTKNIDPDHTFFITDDVNSSLTAS